MLLLKKWLLPAVLLCTLIFSTFANAAELDDSAVFVEAFNAYQQKDYLLAIEKCDQLNQAFPDSPLRDVVLLMISRASLMSGDNERAAKTVTTFNNEFPDSALKPSIEEELKNIAARHAKGEQLAFDRNLQAAAKKVRTDRIAKERAAELKLEMERAAKAKAEQERLAKMKLEAERLEKERLQAEKLAKASIKLALTVQDSANIVQVGSSGTIPFEAVNKGKTGEEFVISVTSAKELNAQLVVNGQPVEESIKLKLMQGEVFKGSLSFRIPNDMVDGQRSTLKINAVSTKFNDVSFQKETIVASSAPLVRVVAKLAKQKVSAGENLKYRVTVLNAGSSAANNLTLRLQLPQQVDFQGSPDFPFKQESNGTLVFTVNQVETGKLADISFDVKIRDNSAAGQELRGQIEVINGSLQRKDIFTAGASKVVAPVKN